MGVQGPSDATTTHFLCQAICALGSRRSALTSRASQVSSCSRQPSSIASIQQFRKNWHLSAGDDVVVGVDEEIGINGFFLCLFRKFCKKALKRFHSVLDLIRKRQNSTFILPKVDEVIFH
jgi:hypothetical protein